MYEIWYDYMKPKYGEGTELCYIDAYSQLYSLLKNSKYLCSIAKNVETRFVISNYE